MPKDPTSKQKFTADHWDSTSSDPEAGKVWVGGVAAGAVFPIVEAATVYSFKFNISATTFASVTDAPGTGRYWELRLVQMGNVATTNCTIGFRWGSGSTSEWEQPLSAGVAFNQNQIGCYTRSAANEKLFVNVTTNTATVKGTVWVAKI